MNKPEQPRPDTDINQALLAGTKITVRMAASRDRKEKLKLFVDLVSEYYSEGSFKGLVRRKRHVLASSDAMEPDTLKWLRKARHGATRKDHQDQATIISLENKIDLALCGDSILSSESIAKIQDMARSFNLDLRSRRKLWLIPSFMIGLLFVPITDKVTSKGVYIGEQSYAVSATSDGTISEIYNSAGQVNEGDPLLTIETLIEGDIRTAESNLQEIITKIREQGVKSTENINLLYRNRKIAEEELAVLREKARLNNVAARRAGILDLKENLLGTVVNRGDQLGIIEPHSQNIVTTEINVNDWIPLESGTPASFIETNNVIPITGYLDHVPLKPTDGHNGKVYKVKVRMDRTMPTGTSGTIVLNGHHTTIGWWLFRKQLGWLVAILN